MSNPKLASFPRNSRSKWPAIVGAVLAAFLAAFAASGSGLPSFSDDDDQGDTGIAVEQRLHRLELNDASQSSDISTIKEDTHHTRDRLDRFLDSQGSH